MTDNENDANPTSEDTTAETTVESPPVVQSADEAPTARNLRGWLRESRPGLTGTGIAIALIFGLGGFAVGHATAGDDDRGWPAPGDHRFGKMPGGGPPMGPPGRPRQEPQQPQPGQSGQPDGLGQE